jgi:aspartate-semialdehyde dehydrogenase
MMDKVNKKLRVGILGATGTVGQRFIELLEYHPQFEVTALAASDRSHGKSYSAACAWRLPGEMPRNVRDLRVHLPQPPLDCDMVFSSLPADIARTTEDEFARAGYPVISNSSAYRMMEDVPLLIPEVNHEHLTLLDTQQQNRNYKSGFIITNPNCSTIALVMALAPLHAQFGIASVIATTFQAISGAGYPGVASLDIADNVIPFIQGEEEKIQVETVKILGKVRAGSIQNAEMLTSAQCHRVNVIDGHLVAVRVKFVRSVQLDEVRELLSSFTSLPQELRLHSAPERPIIVRDEPDRPQPRLDRDAGNGMSVTVGRIAHDRVLDYRFVALGHNTIRGAAGAAILNAELLLAKGIL